MNKSYPIEVIDKDVPKAMIEAQYVRQNRWVWEEEYIHGVSRWEGTF